MKKKTNIIFIQRGVQNQTYVKRLVTSTCTKYPNIGVNPQSLSQTRAIKNQRRLTWRSLTEAQLTCRGPPLSSGRMKPYVSTSLTLASFVLKDRKYIVLVDILKQINLEIRPCGDVLRNGVSPPLFSPWVSSLAY